MRTGLVVLGLLAARCVAAATWTCDQRTEVITGQAYLVTARCTATGSYTSGGDPPGNPGMDLCNSAARRPTAVLPTTALSTGNTQAYVVAFDTTAGKFILGTSGASPGPGNPLVQIAPGPIDGTIIRTLSVCQ